MLDLIGRDKHSGFERSCGAVILRGTGEATRVLVIRQRAGRSTLPKGHVEQNETDEQAALREIQEETGLMPRLDTGFRFLLTRFPKATGSKEICFFVAESDSGEARPQPEELTGLCWLPPAEAAARMDLVSDRVALIAALRYKGLA